MLKKNAKVKKPAKKKQKPKIPVNLPKPPKSPNWQKMGAGSSAAHLHKAAEKEVQKVAATPLPPVTISMVQQSIRPGTWPALSSPSLSMLDEAVSFVAEGKPVSKEFLGSLRRMLSSMEERMELINVTFQHHQAHRLRKIHGALEQLEAIVFNPEQIERLEPDQQIKLIQLLYSESGAITKSMAASSDIPNSEAIDASVDPAQIQAHEVAKKAAGNMPAKTRRALRDTLAKLVQTSRKSIKV
jgi:hypothetical protein